MYPLVSIITPSYNQGQFIKYSIESVISQDYPNIEYIIIDGGSTDNTLEILEEYKDKLIYISEKDEGQSDAINKGFKMAKGEIVAWLNSDDTYAPNCIAKAVEILVANRDVALVYGDGNIIDENGDIVKKFEYTQKFNLWSLIYIWDYIMQPATFFRADALKNVGYLNKDLHWTMDWELWIKLALNYKVEYIPQILANSREYAQTKTSTGAQKRLNEILNLMRKFSGEENPYGYDIYYISEQLSNSKLSVKEHKNMEQNIINLMTFMPIPNRDDRCLSIAKFAYNKNVKTIELVIDLEQSDDLSVKLYVNNELCIQETIHYVGCYKYELDLNKTDNINIVTANFVSDRLSKLGSTYESYVRCYVNVFDETEKTNLREDDTLFEKKEMQTNKNTQFKSYTAKKYESNLTKKRNMFNKIISRIVNFFNR